MEMYSEIRGTADELIIRTTTFSGVLISTLTFWSLSQRTLEYNLRKLLIIFCLFNAPLSWADHNNSQTIAGVCRSHCLLRRLTLTELMRFGLKNERCSPFYLEPVAQLVLLCALTSSSLNKPTNSVSPLSKTALTHLSTPTKEKANGLECLIVCRWNVLLSERG